MDMPMRRAALIAAIDRAHRDAHRKADVIMTVEFWGGALAGFRAALILWWVVDRQRRGR